MANRPVSSTPLPPLKALSSARRPLAEIVASWAADLTPGKAPKQAIRGPLAWVRLDKVPELIAALAKEGYK